MSHIMAHIFQNELYPPLRRSLFAAGLFSSGCTWSHIGKRHEWEMSDRNDNAELEDNGLTGVGPELGGSGDGSTELQQLGRCTCSGEWGDNLRKEMQFIWFEINYTNDWYVLIFYSI